MDEKYLQDLYSWIVSKDPSYRQDVTPEAFRQKMADPTYVSKMHGWISSLDPTFQRDMTIDRFNERIGLGKKKVDTGSFSEDGLSESARIIKPEPQRAVAESTAMKPRMMTAPPKEKEKAGYLKTLYDNLALGASYANEAVASLPETVINLFAIPQNFIAEKTGWNIGTNADKIKKQLGISNPLLDYIQESQKVLKGEVAKDVADRYNDPGIVSNFQKGNYKEGFELLGAGIAQSVPISIGMMLGGAYTAPAKLATVSTLALTEAQRRELEEMDPTMSESEKTIKALGMAGAESLFSSIGTGTIGRVYRDIAAREGTDAAKTILKDGLVQTYKKALEKGGAAAGFAGEGIEEAATQITQNVISGRPAFEGVADAFATGAGSGVVFTTPISAMNAKKYIDNKVQTYQTKDKIGEILKDKADDIDKLYNVPVASEITAEQIEVANLPKSRDILVTNLKKSVSKGAITEDDAKQSLFIFDKIQQVSSAVKDLDLNAEDKAKVATLLKQRDELKTKIQNKDDVLVVQEKQQIDNLNNQIQQIITKPKEDAIQKQAAGEVPVQPTPRDSEALAQGEPQPKPEVITTEGIQEEIITPQVTQEEVTPTVTRVKVAPFFNTQITSTAEAAQLRQSPEYRGYLESLNDIGRKIGIKVTPIESIGGYENEKGERIVEISNDVDLENATMEQAEEFAALAGALAPQVQEATIAAQYLNQEGGNDHKANEYTVVVSDVDGAIDALKAAGISDFSINEKTGEVSFIDVLDFTDPQLQENIGEFIIQLKSKGINYEQQVYKPLNSTRVGKARRKEILGRIKSAGARPVQGREDILPTLEEAVRRDAEFQGVAVDDYFKPRPGNRLFNKPLETVSEIADRYFQRVFGKPRPKYYGSRTLDEARAKRISDAFDAMKHDPNNPEVKTAYEALAKETLDQYKAFTDAGYSVEINNSEPYNDSQEMIDDLRNNNRIKIFSTESGFGESKITDEQRNENPLLRDSGFKDVNGKTLLINDVFRAIHDFYGHAELGNSFGPKGEENAWNVHARMFSPEARKAMTTETRGQNSYVNFSGVNDRITKLREQARALREEGLFAQARKKVEEIYDQMSFADQKVGLLPEEFYQVDETDLGDADRIPEAEVMEEISQELTEADLPGYDRMMGEIEGVIKKSENRGVPFNKIMDNVMEYMKQSKAYENATDVQREALVRDIRSRFKKKEKRAPSVKKILGQEKTMVTVDDYKMMVNQIKMEVRAAREAKGDLNTKRKMLTDAIRSMASTGKIPANRVAALVNRIGKVNLDSNESVERLLDYAGKLFADAEYSNKLGAANTIRSQIRKLSKNKDKFANLRDLGSKFSEIDPSMVDDIDEYNRVASIIKESIKGSTTRSADAKFINMVREADATAYINKTMEAQQKKLFDMRVAEVQELLGVDASELSYDQLMQMLESDKPLTKDNEALVRAAVNKAFDIYSSLIEGSLKTGKDLFTGEDVEYTANQKRVVKEFMDMDLNVLKPKQALEAVDALMNFFQNKSIAKMESVLAKYKGEAEMKALEKKGIKAKPISKYWSKGLGRLLLEQTANLNIVFERMFGGFTKGGMVEDAMGVTQVETGKATAQKKSNSIVKEYVDKFYKSKPNGKAFNTAENNIERGMVAFMSRNVIGTDAEMQEEFQRRKNLILKVDEDGTRTGSIAELEKGNEQEVEKAKIYQQVYDKIVKDSKTIKEVQDKAAKENLDAVNFWQQQWADTYEELSDVALGVYNKVLDKDINYTPDRFSKLSSDPGEVDITAEDMGFLVNSGNAPLYKKETGVLMAATRPESLPRNAQTEKPNRYIDLSFDKNNSNAMYDALIDINTAAPIRQIQSALNSDAFSRIMKGTGDDKLLRNRIDLYIKNIRNKNPFSNDEFSKAVKGLNRLASIGVGQALGGVLQPIKQVVPIAMNTMINAGNLDVKSVFDKSKQDFINKSGYAIANRGVESQAQIESLNKMIDEAAKSKPEQAFKAIEKVNNWWLKNLLVRFDVAIARASWMTYYEQSLKKQGIDPNTIDYSKHEVNQKAAEYAQRQVDRQQNVSDSDLAGALLSSKDASKQLIMKVIMPFASFRMNQSARLGSDLAILTDRSASVEDKKIAARSLAGFAAEMVTFRALSAGSALLIAEVVKEVMGREEDEEKDKKKMDAIVKGQLTSTVADVFSPAPILDKIVQVGASAVLESTQDALDVSDEDKLEIYSGNKQDIFQSLGLLGIAGSRANQLWEMTKLSAGAPYEDDYGRKKYLSEQDREAIGTLIPFAIISNLGLAPSEVNSIVRSSLADAKRAASTIEGGKSKEDVQLEERAKKLSGPRKGVLEQNRQEKVRALRELRDGEVDDDKIKAIDDMINELEMTAEEKKSTQTKKEKIEKEEKMKQLLGGYDNKTDLKRYDPELYEENFGENSEYYQENEAEMEVEQELNKMLQEMEDEKMGYTPAEKLKPKYRLKRKSLKIKRG
jgi:hypothetical protein